MAKVIELKDLWSKLLCCFSPWHMHRMQQAQLTSEEHGLGRIQVLSWDTQNCVRRDPDLHIPKVVQNGQPRGHWVRSKEAAVP